MPHKIVFVHVYAERMASRAEPRFFFMKGSTCVAGIVKMDVSTVMDSAVMASRAARN